MSFRVLFMGTPAFAVPSLQAAIDAGWDVVGAVCQPDKPSGRGQKLQAPPVKELAERHGIPVFQPAKIRNNPEFMATLRELAPDLILVVAYGKILPQEVLDLPKHGCLNVHGSLLPKYRGAAPIQWAIINGDPVTGVTLMKMDIGMDTGDMLAVAELPIAPDDTTGTLFPKLAEVGAKLAAEKIPAWIAGELPPVKQDDAQATMAPMLSKETGAIDWTKPAQQLHDLIRGVNPWPGAHTTLLGETLKIHKARPYGPWGLPPNPPGTLVQLTPEGWLVQAGDGILVLETVQVPGKKAAPAADVARGMAFTLKHGVVLGG